MKIIDNTTNREKIVNIPEGSIFRFNGNYYLKTSTMFTYDEIEDFLDDVEVIDNMEDLENNLLLIRAINLSNGEHHEFDNEVEVEPLKGELRIV